MTAELTVASHAGSEEMVVRVSGVLAGTEADAESLRNALSALAPPTSAVFDLRELRLLTAEGARTLLAVAEALGTRGVRCRVVADPAGATARTLRDVAPASVLPLRTAQADAADTALDTLTAQLASLTRLLMDTTTVSRTLHRIVDAAQSIVSGADLVSITLRDDSGTFFTPVETGPAASALDQVQYDSGDGPCVDAARPDGPAYAASDNLAAETRWPRFARAATGYGLAAVLSTDLKAHRPTAVGGALNIYSTQIGGLGDHDRHAALLLAGHASLALAYTTATEVATLHQQHLHAAIEHRDIIGQAKGILMARQGMTADEAFDVLRRTSQDLNVKLVDIARTLAEHPDRLDTP
ncbi:ANTAR domain-containing protein [Actinophytocola sp. KF-1]